MVQRRHDLARLLKWKDEQVIKVVTGMRRCGKSTLLLQYQDYLRGNGICPEQIIYVNFESLEYEDLLDYRKLYSWLKERLCAGRMTYIFLDEIQKVSSFEKAVDSLFILPDTDIYITGSNAWLLSGDLATLLTGRYIEIRLLPLSFAEYMELTGRDSAEAFPDYLRYGSLPFVAAMSGDSEKIETYLEGIYNTVLVRDIEDRQARLEKEPGKRRITDIALLKTIARYLASVIGSPVSIRSIANYLSSNGRRISPNTVSDYVEALVEAYIFYPVEQFDIAGKTILKAGRKFYISDPGLRNHIITRENYDLGFTLENVVYLELLRRGYRVSVGRSEDGEVDFVAERQGIYTYLQVTADMSAQQTFEREMKPLRSIRDNYEKIVLTMDRLTPGNYDGIRVIYLIDYLCAYGS